MGRIRTIKPEFWTDEDMSSVAIETQLLAVGLLNYVDDEGYFNANPKLIKAAIFPLREFSDSSLSIHGMLNELSNIHYIQLYHDENGKQYGHVINFLKHQVINRSTPSKIKDLCKFIDESRSAHGALTERSPLEWNGSGSGNGSGNGKSKISQEKSKDFSGASEDALSNSPPKIPIGKELVTKRKRIIKKSKGIGVHELIESSKERRPREKPDAPLVRALQDFKLEPSKNPYLARWKDKPVENWVPVDFLGFYFFEFKDVLGSEAKSMDGIKTFEKFKSLVKKFQEARFSGDEQDFKDYITWAVKFLSEQEKFSPDINTIFKLYSEWLPNTYLKWKAKGNGKLKNEKSKWKSKAEYRKAADNFYCKSENAGKKFPDYEE